MSASSFRRRLGGVLVALSAVLAPIAGSAGPFHGPSPREIGDAITELDVERARELLARAGADSAPIALERARLSLYVGDCDAALATLATLGGVKEAAPMLDVARPCARATAGSVVVEDPARGLWIRLQDEGDRAIVPLISDVAAHAREAIERDLGVVMPRPLRIDLVRDLFSLSAVSGLPLKAAETTGTVAVARWGRVNMISPRAAPGGYPWEDTLAHEITHLALTRATRDTAPLWLQEGTAKRQETRWRPPRPFDREPPWDEVARDALLSGESVGVDRLGPSIAMLPSADAASIAFAEVASFVDYWIATNGRAALQLLYLDMKGQDAPDADAALVSTTGYDLAGWIVRWQRHLLDLPARAEAAPGVDPADAARAALQALEVHSMPIDARDRARHVRTADLLLARGAPAMASIRMGRVFTVDEHEASVRWRYGRSLIAEGRAAEAAVLFADVGQVSSAHPGWYALQGLFRRTRAAADADESFSLARSLDPYLEDAACDGHFTKYDAAGKALPAEVPATDGARALCEAARKIHVE